MELEVEEWLEIEKWDNAGMGFLGIDRSIGLKILGMQPSLAIERSLEGDPVTCTFCLRFPS